MGTMALCIAAARIHRDAFGSMSPFFVAPLGWDARETTTLGFLDSEQITHHLVEYFGG
jgi:hypothetical protein